MNPLAQWVESPEKPEGFRTFTRVGWNVEAQTLGGSWVSWFVDPLRDRADADQWAQDQVTRTHIRARRVVGVIEHRVVFVPQDGEVFHP